MPQSLHNVDPRFAALLTDERFKKSNAGQPDTDTAVDNDDEDEDDEEEEDDEDDEDADEDEDMEEYADRIGGQGYWESAGEFSEKASGSQPQFYQEATSVRVLTKL